MLAPSAAELLPIRMARLDDPVVDAFLQFLGAHFQESGQDGSPHFALSRHIAREEFRANVIGRWAKRLDEPLWGRAWLLWSSEPPPPPRAGFTFRSSPPPASSAPR